MMSQISVHILPSATVDGHVVVRDGEIFDMLVSFRCTDVLCGGV